VEAAEAVAAAAAEEIAVAIAATDRT